MHIAILLATYNGERYLREQIDSLLTQTCQQWDLYVHDDGSKDNTVKILKEYEQEYDNIHILDAPSTGNAKDNFFLLLDAVEADYYFFCDQDDVWFADKIEKELTALRAQEAKKPDVPVVVYTDLKVADEQMRVIHESMWRFSAIHPEFLTTFDTYAYAVATGCTMCFNHKAKEVSRRGRETAIMHDCWVLLATVAHGGIGIPMHEATLFYRQHTGNCVGAVEATRPTWKKRIAEFGKGWKDQYNYYQMLRVLNYGSFLKYMKNYVRYRRMAKRLMR